MKITEEIFDEIDVVVTESQIEVFESMCNAYDKAYDILEYCSTDETDINMFSIVQEATVSDNEDESEPDAEAKKKKKQGNILSRILDAIVGFFKMIGSAIANLFKKVKEGVTDKLRKLSKKNDSECAAVQEIIEETPAEKKIETVATNFEQKIELKEELTDNSKSKEDKEAERKDAVKGSSSNKTKIVVKEKKIKTHIKFDAWINFLEYANEWSQKVVNTVSNIVSKADVKSAIVNRPTRSIQGKSKYDLKNIYVDGSYEKVQGKLADFVGDIKGGKEVRQARLKNQAMFSGFCKKYPVSEVADNIDKINELLKKNIESSKKAYEQFDKLKKVCDSDAHDPVFHKLAKDVTKIHTELANIAGVTVALAKYIGMELNLYDSMLAVIIPLFDDAEKKAKELEAESRTIYVVKKDEDKKDEEK